MDVLSDTINCAYLNNLLYNYEFLIELPHGAMDNTSMS